VGVIRKIPVPRAGGPFKPFFWLEWGCSRRVRRVAHFYVARLPSHLKRYDGATTGVGSRPAIHFVSIWR
jgi:hypothetical protein